MILIRMKALQVEKEQLLKSIDTKGTSLGSTLLFRYREHFFVLRMALARSFRTRHHRVSAGSSDSVCTFLLYEVPQSQAHFNDSRGR